MFLVEGLFGSIGILIIAGIIGGVIAHQKNRFVIGWTILCALIPFLIVLLLILPKTFAEGEEDKICPQCAESVKAQAKICRFCRFEFPEVDIPEAKPDVTENDVPRTREEQILARFQGASTSKPDGKRDDDGRT